MARDRDLYSESFPVQIERAVNELYLSVITPETWTIALHHFAQATDSVGCLFYPRDQTQMLLELPVSIDLRDFIDAYVNESWFQFDVHAAKGWPLAAKGKRVLTDDDIASAEERDQSIYFPDFQRPCKLPHWAAITFRVDGGLWCMPLLRSERQGPVSSEQMPILQGVASHLSRVIQLAQIRNLRQAAEWIETLNLVGHPAVLLDGQGRLLAITSVAETMLGDEIRLVKNKIIATDARTNESLQNAVRAATDGRQTRGGLPAVIAVERSSALPIVLKITSIPKLLSDVFGRTRVFIEFFDTGKKFRAREEIIRSTFGLTKAEATLATEIGLGASLQIAADKLGICKETARAQLKAAFRKTGTHSQSEFNSLLSKLPPQ